MKKFMVMGVLLLGVSITLFGLVVANDSEKSYIISSGVSSVKSTSNDEIKNLVINGAGYFLSSNSAYQQLLYQVEMDELNGYNYIDLRYWIGETIAALENAKTTYGELKTLAAQTPYNPEVIEALKAFDYTGFQEKNSLNDVTFSTVKQFLINGNVTGIYEEVYSRVSEILCLLYTVKGSFEQDQFPGIEILWQANQLYNETLMFGQQTSMVFMNRGL